MKPARHEGWLTLAIFDRDGHGNRLRKDHSEMTGVAKLHAEFTAKNYSCLRPGVEKAPWGATTLTVTDPFMNRILFSEPDLKKA